MLRWVVRSWVVGLLLSAPAFAQDAATLSSARELAIDGLRAYDEGQYDAAAEQLGRAYQIVRVPTLGRDLARALVQTGQLVEAAELYLEVTRLELTGEQAASQADAKQDAARERAALLPRIPRLVIEVSGADAERVSVRIDGVAVPSALLGVSRWVNPGEHAVIASYGAETQPQSFTIAEGEQRKVRFAFGEPTSKPLGPSRGAPSSPVPTREEERPSGPGSESPAANARTSPQRTAGWISVGVGGAGVLFGSVTGLWAVALKRELDREGCLEGRCFDDQSGDVNRYDSLRWASGAGLAAGAALLALGGAVVLTSPRQRTAARVSVSPWLGVGQAGLSGGF